MKKSAGAILIGVGILVTLTSGLNARNAPNLPHLVGTFLPGLLLLIVGLALRGGKTPRTPSRLAADGREMDDLGNAGDSDRFKIMANLGVGIGIVAMFMG